MIAISISRTRFLDDDDDDDAEFHGNKSSDKDVRLESILRFVCRIAIESRWAIKKKKKKNRTIEIYGAEGDCSFLPRKILRTEKRISKVA